MNIRVKLSFLALFSKFQSIGRNGFVQKSQNFVTLLFVVGYLF